MDNLKKKQICIVKSENVWSSLFLSHGQFTKK